MSQAAQRRIEGLLLLGCLALLAWFAWRDSHARMMWGRERVNIALGLWGTRFLLAGLAITPLSQILRQPTLKRLRRPLGLAAAAFAVIHGVHYLIYVNVWPDHLYVFVRRPYLTIGLIALVLLLPLAATSSHKAVVWLHPRRWRALHLLVYPAAILTVLHEALSWAVMMGEVGLHVVALCLLLAWRIVALARRLWPSRRPVAPVPAG